MQLMKHNDDTIEIALFPVVKSDSFGIYEFSLRKLLPTKIMTHFQITMNLKIVS